MSRLTELIAQVEQKDAALAEELRKEFDEYSKRRQFGLNFERHMPETVRLYNRPIRRGDKVNVLPERGKPERKENNQVLTVKSISRKKKTAKVERIDNPDESLVVALDDLVVIAEFSEPIYPGLKETGRVERGGDKPYQVVINGENYHALETLLYAYEGKVDCIYIDPPYNTGDKSWKYNNDYVDSDDSYRHSKWLAFMERRLKLARRLLNPDDSVLIVTIDEKEYSRLGLLLEQVFTNAKIQMITSVINPKGTSRPDLFSRVDEYLYIVLIGNAVVPSARDYSSAGKPIRWRYLRREDLESVRGSRPRQFYPVFVSADTEKVVGVGEPLSPEESLDSVDVPDGCVAVYPIREDGLHMEWGLTGGALLSANDGGFVRATPGHAHQPFIISYLTAPNIKKIENGELTIVGERPDGSKIVVSPEGKLSRPSTVWAKKSHSAGDYGTKMLNSLLQGRKFPFPKSLYAVEDTLRFFVAGKPNALIVDFFAGSGTTAHAVMRLNKQDGGQRRSVCVTNNEVSADEAKKLLKKGMRQGDPEWEALGIAEYITKPRVTAAITGKTSDGDPIKGGYRFTDEFPMSDGFEENAIFYDLTYQDEVSVELDRAFEEIAPLLWMKAGSQGRCICERSDAFDIAETYGILFDYHAANAFLEALEDSSTARIAYIVTNQDSRFQDVAQRLPEGIEPVRLYESYIRSFRINRGEG